MDGWTLPPKGAAAYFIALNVAARTLDHWRIKIDFNAPANPANLVALTSMVPPAFDFACAGNCVPQPGAGANLGLETLGASRQVGQARLMFRLAYRNFGTHDAAVVTHSVAVDGVTAPRWYEIRDITGSNTPRLYQSGTFRPGDDIHRWMGSVAFDRVGNIGIGYSMSSATLFPSIGVAGRLVDDILNTITQVRADVGHRATGLTEIERTFDVHAGNQDTAASAKGNVLNAIRTAHTSRSSERS